MKTFTAGHRRYRAIVLMLLLLVGSGLNAALAQSPVQQPASGLPSAALPSAALPSGESPQSESPRSESPRSESPMSNSPMSGWTGLVSMHLAGTVQRASTVLAALPHMPRDWISAVSGLAADPSSLRAGLGDPRIWVFLLAMIAATGVLPQWLLGFFETRDRAPLWRAVGRLGFELPGIGIAVLLGALATATVLMAAGSAETVGPELLWLVVRWRVTTLLVLVLLRPGAPDIRLLPVSSVDAKRIVRTCYVSLAVIILSTTLISFFSRHGLPTASAQLSAVIAGTVSIVLFIRALRQLSRAMPGHEVAILLLGGTLAVTAWVIWTLAVLTLDFGVYLTFLNVVLVSWLLLAVVRILGLPHGKDTEDEAGPAMGGSRPLVAALQRSLVVIAVAISIAVMARIWAVQVLGVVMDVELVRVTDSLRSAFIVLIGGYVAYEAVKAWAAARFGTDVALAGPQSEDVEDLHPRSRLSTIIPILTASMLVVVVLISVLLGLSDLGFNTAPILAGAGIFGLAISFGSQALVRDIVSGIFYMVDDAFRIGEYIETGRQKGTVEKIMIRSLRVRHQNGQFHTIPYGQLGAVTNYSRDWSTIKFNLSLARDSNLETVRKATKQCGQALLADPEFGQEFILPLKFQGIADIRENAVICRFKFTVRPLRPTQVQREALKRLHAALIAKGIEFATHTVKIITAPGTNASDAAVSAAATTIMRLAPPASVAGVDPADASQAMAAGGEKSH